MRRIAFVLVALTVALDVRAFAEERTDHEIFADANSHFENATSDEDLRLAASEYEQLIRNGRRNAHLFYNLGNTHLRLSDLGGAILNFRRALAFSPEDPYAAAMLEEARAKIRETVPDLYETSSGGGLVRTLFFWHFRTPFRARLAALVFIATVFWLLLTLKLFTRLPLHRFAMGASLVVGLALAASLVTSRVQDRGRDAVLTAKETTVFSENSEKSEEALDGLVPSGIEVTVLEERGLWLLIRFPNGATGWVRAKSAGFVELD